MFWLPASQDPHVPERLILMSLPVNVRIAPGAKEESLEGSIETLLISRPERKLMSKPLKSVTEKGPRPGFVMVMTLAAKVTLAFPGETTWRPSVTVIGPDSVSVSDSVGNRYFTSTVLPRMESAWAAKGMPSKSRAVKTAERRRIETPWLKVSGSVINFVQEV